MRSLIIALALAAALVNPVFAQNKLSDDTKSLIILKGKLVAEYISGPLFKQVLHYKGKFYGCTFLVGENNTWINCAQARFD